MTTPTCTQESHDAIRSTPARWAACAFIGFWQVDGEVYESRNCRECGSTLERQRCGYLWCTGGHAAPRPIAGMEADALGRLWCAPCRRAEELAAQGDARGNDGVP